MGGAEKNPNSAGDVLYSRSAVRSDRTLLASAPTADHEYENFASASVITGERVHTMSRFIDERLDGGSELWRRADDEKFWLDGNSSENEELGWKPKVVDGDEKSSSSEAEAPDASEAKPKEHKKAKKDKKEKKQGWERQYEQKYKELWDALHTRPRPRKEEKERTTDAILSCPGCFSLVCDVCQRHEVDFNRWKALEISDTCAVGGERRFEEDYGYYPVACTVCGAELGAYDDEQTYHLYNVVPSSS